MKLVVPILKSVSTSLSQGNHSTVSSIEARPLPGRMSSYNLLYPMQTWENTLILESSAISESLETRRVRERMLWIQREERGTVLREKMGGWAPSSKGVWSYATCRAGSHLYPLWDEILYLGGCGVPGRTMAVTGVEEVRGTNLCNFSNKI